MNHYSRYTLFSLLLLVQLITYGPSMYASAESTKINLIWQFEPQHRCEEDWLLEILSGSDLNVISDCNYEVFLDNSIIIISYWFGQERQLEYFQTLSDLGYKFAIIHLSDEFYRADTDFYPLAKFVLRSYWHKKFEGMNNVITLPLGYKAGFWREDLPEKIKSSCERSYTWSFAGQISNKPTRMEMIESLKHVPGYYIYETNTWADPNGLSTIAYRNMLLESIFAPCPTGFWNLDSFRSSESLECGCIPIVERGPNDYFAKFMGDHPFIVVNSWDEAPELMLALINNPAELEARRLACGEWWINYKTTVKKQVAKLIKDQISPSSD